MIKLDQPWYESFLYCHSLLERYKRVSFCIFYVLEKQFQLFLNSVVEIFSFFAMYPYIHYNKIWTFMTCCWWLLEKPANFRVQLSGTILDSLSPIRPLEIEIEWPELFLAECYQTNFSWPSRILLPTATQSHGPMMLSHYQLSIFCFISISLILVHYFIGATVFTRV